jgi:hypothetical protein
MSLPPPIFWQKFKKNPKFEPSTLSMPSMSGCKKIFLSFSGVGVDEKWEGARYRRGPDSVGASFRTG